MVDTTDEPERNFDIDLVDASEELIAAALGYADVPPLLCALAGALDDPDLVPDHLRPDLSIPMDPDAGLSADQQAEARALALPALLRIKAQGPRPATAIATDKLRPLLEYLASDDQIDDDIALCREELALGEDPRAPGWIKADVAPDREFRVAIIGAGMSGLVAAHRLRQAGVDVTIFEKDTDVGGTWLENSYPGCRVDVSNHFYSYSFAQRPDWPGHFSERDVLLDYFRDVADDHGIRPLIRFNTQVTEMRFDEPSGLWRLALATPDGDTSNFEANIVISAVGQLNRPHIPDITGRDTFAGPSFHSAAWDHSVDLADKRVAVIGTGGSAAQLIPHVAEEAAELTIYQRTPAWFLPTPDYEDPVAPGAQWLFRNVAGYANWFRFWIFFRNVEGLIPAATVDPDWEGHRDSVGPFNDLVRQLFTAYLEAEFADHPDLLAKVIPDYPPFAKRFIRDDGAWARTLTRDNVELVTDPVDEITTDGVRTVAGRERAADVIIYGTGFLASDFLMPMRVIGRDGVPLHDQWAGDARAYLGMTLPGFPNLFMLYGPNTNIVVNGSIFFFSECAVTYILGCVHELLDGGFGALEPKVAVHDEFNQRVDAENLKMAWGTSSVHSWYRNATGRTAQNWPFSLADYWRATRAPDLDEFEVTPAPS